jgi:hypothetical protein
MNASSRPDACVENAGEVTVVLFVPWSRDTIASSVSALAPPPDGCPVKFSDPTLAPFTVTLTLAGVNANPFFEGVTLYVPFANPAKL